MGDDKYYYTVYYKGETESPIKSGGYPLYWWYERCYFTQTDNPNEEDFKDYMIAAIDKVSEHFKSFQKALEDYFDIEKQKKFPTSAKNR